MPGGVVSEGRQMRDPVLLAVLSCALLAALESCALLAALESDCGPAALLERFILHQMCKNNQQGVCQHTGQVKSANSYRKMHYYSAQRQPVQQSMAQCLHGHRSALTLCGNALYVQTPFTPNRIVLRVW
jgi:hypothetical protein